MDFLLEHVFNALPLSLLFAAATWGFLRLARNVNAATRHFVWWMVLAVIFLLPFKPDQMSIVDQPEQPARAAMTIPLDERAGEFTWIALALFGVTAVLVARLLLHSVALHWMKWRAVKLDNSRLEHWRKHAGILRRVSLRESRHVPSPVACGYLLPAIVLPEGFAQRTAEEDLDHVLLHELGHIARFDDFTQLFARLLEAVAWWHPLVLLLLRRIELEREIACDDWALAQTRQEDHAQRYAATLTRLVEARLADEASVLAPGIGGRRSQFARRIERLLNPQRNARPTWAFGSLGATLLVLAAIALAAARMPAVLAFAADKNHGPDRPGFLAALAQAGYRDLSVDEIIQLKNQGVRGEYVAQINEAQGGKTRLKPSQLLELHRNGISPANLRAAKQYGDRLTLEQIIRLKHAGVL